MVEIVVDAVSFSSLYTYQKLAAVGQASHSKSLTSLPWIWNQELEGRKVSSCSCFPPL